MNVTEVYCSRPFLYSVEMIPTKRLSFPCKGSDFPFETYFLGCLDRIMSVATHVLWAIFWLIDIKLTAMLRGGTRLGRVGHISQVHTVWSALRQEVLLNI
jgi:hypothetical protein